jgi:hypothetical protein
LFRGKAIIKNKVTYRGAIQPKRSDCAVQATATVPQLAGYQFLRDQFIVAPRIGAYPQFLFVFGTALILAVIRLAHFAFVFVKVLSATWHYQSPTPLELASFYNLVLRMTIYASLVSDAIFQVVFLNTWHQITSSWKGSRKTDCALSSLQHWCRLARSSVSEVTKGGVNVRLGVFDPRSG